MSMSYVERLDHDRRMLATVREVVDVPILRVGVENALKVPPIGDASRHFGYIEWHLNASADTMVTIGVELLEEAHRRIPRALIGKSGLVADAALRDMSNVAMRTARILQTAAEELKERGRTVRSLYHAHDADAVESLRKLYDGPIAHVSQAGVPDPVPDSLTEEVRRLATMAITHVNERRQAHAGLAASLDQVTAFLNDLTGQAILAKLGSSPLPAIEELVIANAATGNSLNPVLTAHAAERAARNLSTMPEERRVGIENLLNRAQSPLERAYLLKAVAAGNDNHSLGELADRIRSKEPAWIERNLNPLGAERGPLDDSTPPGSGHPLTSIDHTRYPVGRAVADLELLTDPYAAMRMTDPGSGVPFAERYEDRAREMQTEAMFRRQADWSTFEYGVVLGNTLQREVGTSGGVAFEDARPGPDTVARIASAVDHGFPVPVILGENADTENIDKTTTAVVTGHNGGMFHVRYADGTVGWVNGNDFLGGSPDRTPSVPVTVIMPTWPQGFGP